MATKAEKPKVPRGWRIVKGGYVRPTDKIWDTHEWVGPGFYAGDLVSDFYAVIRREEKARTT